MRTKLFLCNSFFTALLQIITMLAGFIIPRIMLSTYGSEINGLVTSISQFIGYFTLVEAGLASAAVYALYKPLADENYKEVNSILTASKNFYNQAGIIFSILVVGLAVLYPFIVKTNVLNDKEVFCLVLALGASGAIDFFTMAKYRILLTASQMIYVVSIASIINIIINTILIAILAHYKVNIIILRVVALLTVFLRTFILYFYTKRNFKYISYNEVPNKKALNKRWDALYLQILGSVHTGTPVVIATIFTTLSSVSVYSIYNMVLAGVSGILSIFISGLSSSFGDVISKGEQTTLQRAYEEFELAYYMIISWAYGCVMILLMPFIKVYTAGVTDIQYYYPFLGVLFILNGIMYNLKTPQGMLVISAGLYRETRLQVTIQGVIAVVGSLILVQFWGLYGIVVGMIFSNLYRDIDLLLYIPRNLTKLPVKKSFYRMIRVLITVAISYLPFLFIKINPSNLPIWLLYAVGISIYVFVVTLIINYLLDRDAFRKIIVRIIIVLKSIVNKG